MKGIPNALQKNVLKRLSKGLPPTRWQRLRLHLAALQRHPRQMSFRTFLFQVRGILRTCNPAKAAEPKKQTRKIARKRKR